LIDGYLREPVRAASSSGSCGRLGAILI